MSNVVNIRIAHVPIISKRMKGAIKGWKFSKDGSESTSQLLWEKIKVEKTLKEEKCIKIVIIREKKGTMSHPLIPL